MKIFLVLNDETHLYLHLWDHALVTWVPRDEATIYNTYDDADSARDIVFNCEFNPSDHYTIVEIDIDAALEVLRDLMQVCDLGDFIYSIRDQEGLGWNGPLVTKWNDAVMRAKELLKKDEGNR